MDKLILGEDIGETSDFQGVFGLPSNLGRPRQRLVLPRKGLVRLGASQKQSESRTHNKMSIECRINKIKRQDIKTVWFMNYIHTLKLYKLHFAFIECFDNMYKA